MEGKYIFAIVILGIFFVLILVSLAFLEFKRKSDERLQAWIMERYADKNLNKPDYDILSAEEDISDQTIKEEQRIEIISPEEVTKSDEESEPASSAQDSYGKIEVEGIEEITGNYNGN